MNRPTDGQPPSRYLSRGQLAQGGMAVIMKEYDHALLRTVARKVLTQDPGNAGTRQRFVEEAQITAQLEHPAIIPVHDVTADAQGTPSFTMKLVVGDTLLQLLQTPAYDVGTEDGMRRALGVFLRVCDAVAFAHSKGVIHRDLKPENIMVGSYGQVYVMDWGVALVRGESPSTSVDEHTLVQRPAGALDDPPGTVIGTLTYMAPEQANGLVSDADERTDIFALGGILYEILTLLPPYQAYSLEELGQLCRAGVVKHPQGVVPRERVLPPLLCKIAMKALQRRQEDRYWSVEDLRADVDRFLRGGNWFGQQHFPAGTLIIQQGDHADAAFIITRGECEAFSVDNEGRETHLRTMGPGAVFGEAAIFSAQPRSASVRALTDLTAVVVTREALTQEIGMDSWTGAFVKTLAERFRELDTRHSLLRQEHDDRAMLMNAVDFMAFHAHPAPPDGLGAPLSLLAQSLGLDVEGTIRLLGRSRKFAVDAAQDSVVMHRG